MGTFFQLQVFKGAGISQVNIYGWGKWKDSMLANNPSFRYNVNESLINDTSFVVNISSSLTIFYILP